MITLSKLAKIAHVSLSTASKAFSMSNEVNEKTREEIFKIAKEYGVFRKFYNSKYSKWIIAVICPELTSNFYTEHLCKIHRYLKEYECEIIVAVTNFSKEKCDELLNYYEKHTSVDGVISLTAISNSSVAELPIVCLNENTISDHFFNGIDQMIKYFKSKNVSDIGFLGENLTRSKKDAFEAILRKNGFELNSQFVYISENRLEKAGFEGMNYLLSLSSPPRAVLCAYDHIAIGAMRAVSKRGLNVPKDIAIVGMDNISMSEFLTPSLASIDSSVDFKCKSLVDNIINKLNGNEINLSEEPPSTFVLRESAKID